MLMWVFWCVLVEYVARPVELVCCIHLDVPKSAICDKNVRDITSPEFNSPTHDRRESQANGSWTSSNARLMVERA